jgi:nucleotide-binding universal stress UspA family protein
MLGAVDLGWQDHPAHRPEGTPPIRPRPSASGEAALGAAVREARLGGADLTVIHALPMDPGAPMLPEGVVAAITARQELASVVIEVLLEALERVGCAAPEKVPILVEDGPAERAILEVAARVHAELVVVGSVVPKGLGEALLGNVAEAVAREAPCSVLVVRSPESATAAGAAGA